MCILIIMKHISNLLRYVTFQYIFWNKGENIHSKPLQAYLVI